MADMTPERTVEQADETCCRSSRRALLRAAGVGGAVAAVGITAAACGTSSGGSVSNPVPAGGASATGGAPGGGANAGGGAPLGKTSDIPVNGGVVYPDVRVVVTQPSAGTFKAFSAVCTHAGCTVGNVADNQISCPCHGSAFSAKDGSVINGPASSPLDAKKLTVADGQFTVS